MAKKTINDPVFGELEYNEKEGHWTKKIFLGIWGGDDYQLDLMIKCEKNEEITEVQREAYQNYLGKLPIIAKTFPLLILTFYKEHYEDFDRNRTLSDNLKYETVGEKILVKRTEFKAVFIDRNGNFGWLVNFLWKNYPITVILSDDKIRIYEGWAVLVMNYNRVDDEVFGDMVYDRSWQKWVKRDYNGLKGEWFPVVAKAYSDEKITAEQRTNYLKYIENEESFFDEIPNALMTYYLNFYDEIEDSWQEIPMKYHKDNINKDSLMELITFHKLFFNSDGKRYGWLCGCAWDSVYGLSFYYDGEHEDMQVGWKDDLFR